MQIWKSIDTWWSKEMGPDQIIQGEKRIEDKIQRILHIKGHVQGKRAYKKQLKKSDQSDMRQNRIVTTQKPRDKKAFQEGERNTGKC